MFSGINNGAQRENNFPSQHTETLISLLNTTPLFHDILRFTDNMMMYALCVCFLIKNLKLTNSTSQHFQSNVGLIKHALINIVKNGFATDSIEVLDKKIANFEGTPLPDLYNQLIREFLRTCQPIPSKKLISN